jgi:carbamoylphosphate synthase small subunit
MIFQVLNTHDVHQSTRVYGKGRSPTIIAYDCGMKLNILRHLLHEQVRYDYKFIILWRRC